MRALGSIFCAADRNFLLKVAQAAQDHALAAKPTSRARAPRTFAADFRPRLP
jgi:hypothetical protein